MRDHSRVAPQFWTDHRGNAWPVITSARRLKFKYPAHAALRAHVFHRDNYTCQRCGAQAIEVPLDYDGRSALWTDQPLFRGWRRMLVMDHVLTLKAGGRSVIENLQALCEICNRRKQREDRAATAAFHLTGGAK